ncbi:MAG TPA: hypothetical protein VMZ03_03725 [Chitinophagaceae bacterium]|nr:hypothetical protein [Chitinophagaceae bacterium]
MRAKTYIFSAGFILILAALHIQPLFIQYGSIKKEMACPKMVKPACSKSKCSKQVPANEKDKDKGCTSKGCNPFLPCAVGMCCYLVETPFTYSAILIASKQKISLVNDNRIQKNLSECWHPPEVFS